MDISPYVTKVFLSILLTPLLFLFQDGTPRHSGEPTDLRMGAMVAKYLVLTNLFPGPISQVCVCVLKLNHPDHYLEILTLYKM